MPIKRINVIERKANELLVKSGIDSLPIPIEKVAANVGADVVAYDLGTEVSGVLVINDNGGIIGVNPNQSRARRRFTIAHELAHFVLHRHESKGLFVDKDFIVKFRSKKKYSSTEKKHEREANKFAAALLMPEKFILEEMNSEEMKNFSEGELIERLAKTFDVSIPAMTYRLIDLRQF